MRIHIVVLVHVLLAALAVGAIAVWGTGADPALAGQRVTVPDRDPRLPDNPERLAIVRPPGVLVTDTATVKQGTAPSVLPEGEAEVLTDAGVVEVNAYVAREDGITQGLWQMSVRDGGDPRQALRAIDDLYAAGGWRQAPTPDRDVLVREQRPAGGQRFSGYRAHYVRGPYLIRIEAYGTDQAKVDDAFATLAGRQLAQWPPR
ncbi:hypothetical protein [Actinophytocola sp.]|uniref:hypothetical protein n=1 Tax=Actinophytocola sp. TaxID=1872138 RepID=UPI0038999E84